MQDIADEIVEGAAGSDGYAFYSEPLLKSLITHTYNSVGYEVKELEHFLSAVEGCDLFVDLGANSGRYTYAAAQRLHDARIIAIEANSYLIPLLQSLCGILKRDYPENSYGVENAAVLDQPGKVEFFVAASPTLSSVFPSEKARRVSVEAATLDSFYQPARKTLVKIDVEGAEYRVLLSGRRFLESPHCEFFLELHGWGDEAIGKYPVHVLLFMARQGYAVQLVGRHHFFRRGSAVQVWTSCALAFPGLFAKFLAYRYARKFVPSFRRLRATLLKAVTRQSEPLR